MSRPPRHSRQGRCRTTAGRSGLEFKGLGKLAKQLARLPAQLKSDVENALRAEAEIEMAEAKRRAPVETGALKRRMGGR